MALKVIALSPKIYIRDKANIFDAVLVLLSIIELVLVEYALNQVKLSYLLVLRGFRIFRVLKLASKWRTLQNLIETLLSSLIDVFNVWVIYILFLLTFALLGVNFFG